MDTLYRHWLILRMIPRKGRIATTDLLGRLQSEYGIETTLRTIQRDLISLEASEFPLECDSNRPAGWSWRKDAPSFDIPNMEPLAALTFRLVRDSMTRMLPRAALASLDGYFCAADERLKKLPESNLSHWADKVRVVSRNLRLEAPEVDEVLLDMVYEALQREVRFEVIYRRKSGGEKGYKVNPLGLVFVDNLVYLVATVQDYKEPIQLLVHRMKSVTLLEQKSFTPEGFSLQNYIDNGEFGYPVGGMIRLKVLFEAKTAQHLYENALSANQKLTKKPDGKVLLEANVRDDVQLRWWLKGFGYKVEVIEPKQLRDEFVEIARELAGIYRRPRLTPLEI